MNRARTFYVVVGVHLGGIVLLVCGSFVKYLIRPKKPPEVVTWVSMEQPLTPPLHMVEEAFKPEDIPKPPEPLPPEPPKPEPPPIPKPKLKKPDEITIAKKKVRRNPDAAPEPPRPPPPKQVTQEELKRMMAEEIAATAAPGPTMSPSELDFIYGLVREKMYGAWQKPGGLTAASGLTATVSIRLSRNGAVSQVSMLRPSGHAAMDASVLQAARSVTHIASLPANFPGAYKDITIAFELRD